MTAIPLGQMSGRAPEGRALRPDEVHLWLAPLDPPPARAQAWLRSLSPEEVGRARSIASAAARRRWSVGRATLRHLLSRYTGTEPERLRLAREPGGRPRLSDGLPGRELHFSLSRSGERVLIAVARTPSLGVDLELVRSLAAPGPLVRRCLTARERAALGRLPRAERPRAILACWTRKEALLKARGVGLRVAPASVEVGLGIRSPPARTRSDDAASSGRTGAGLRARDGWCFRARDGWCLGTLEPAPGYVASLAVRGHGWRLLGTAVGP